MTPKTIPITSHALIQRMRRHCRQSGETFHVARWLFGRFYDPRNPSAGSECVAYPDPDLGQYYMTGPDAEGFDVLKRTWQSLDTLVETARELGVLKPYEVVGDTNEYRRLIGVEEVTS